jgi:hypothetical protein
MLLTNDPPPVPSVVWLPVIAGADDVLQQTPLAVTVTPPSKVTFPPLVAVVWAMLLAALVVTAGMVALSVVKVSSFPYAVPAMLVA